MNESKPLHRFPVLATSHADEFVGWMVTRYPRALLEVDDSGCPFDAVLNRHSLSALSISYTRYGAPIESFADGNDAFLQGIPLCGRGEVSVNRRARTTDAERGGVVAGPGASIKARYSADFEHFVVSMSRAALTRTLSALIDHPIDPPLQLADAGDYEPHYIDGQRRLARFIAGEIDRGGGRLPAAAVASLEQAFMVSYLHGTQHNYSHLLKGEPRAAAPWQVRRALEYIEQNWDQPITIEALAMVTRTSVRSLFHLFKKSRGVSPMVFVKQVRLRHAREMLSHPEAGATVTSIAFLCGFSNMGHFAKDYVSAFGEKPSETLSARR